MIIPAEVHRELETLVPLQSQPISPQESGFSHDHRAHPWATRAVPTWKKPDAPGSVGDHAEFLGQLQGRKFTDPNSDEPGLAIKKKSCRKSFLIKLGAYLTRGIQQHIAQWQLLRFQPTSDTFTRLSLIDKNEVHGWIASLGLLQERHFANTGRTPRCPEVDHRWPARVVA